MKIIFLDIDGVLQPYNNSERFNHNLNEIVMVETYDRLTEGDKIKILDVLKIHP